MCECDGGNDYSVSVFAKENSQAFPGLLITIKHCWVFWARIPCRRASSAISICTIFVPDCFVSRNGTLGYLF